ncbi:MAG: hypothetical protein AAF439_15625 [Pseudomonadota bacterium]
MAGGWGDRLKDLGQDLINIEVNTILTDGMTGRKMPPYPEALLEIAEAYDRYLRDRAKLPVNNYLHGARVRHERAKSGAVEKADAPTDFEPPEGAELEEVSNNEVTFRGLRWTALVALNQHEEAVLRLSQLEEAAGDVEADEQTEAALLDPEIQTVLRRIERNSGQLELLVQRIAQDPAKDLIGVASKVLYDTLGKPETKLPEIPAVDLTRIRKMWELGTDRIVLQSVLQMDGDVIFRADKNLDLNARAPLVEAHRKFVDLGVTHWRTMFELLANLVTSLAGRLFGTR